MFEFRAILFRQKYFEPLCLYWGYPVYYKKFYDDGIGKQMWKGAYDRHNSGAKPDKTLELPACPPHSFSVQNPDGTLTTTYSKQVLNIGRLKLEPDEKSDFVKLYFKLPRPEQNYLRTFISSHRHVWS